MSPSAAPTFLLARARAAAQLRTAARFRLRQENLDSDLRQFLLGLGVNGSFQLAQESPLGSEGLPEEESIERATLSRPGLT